MTATVEFESDGAGWAPADDSPYRRFAQDFCANWVAVAGLIVFSLMVALALAAPWLSPQNPYDLAQLNILDSLQTPGAVGLDGHRYWLGTDDQGRDLLSAILYGIRISIEVGAVSALVALVLGTMVGIVSAYFGGWVDALFMRIVDIQLSFPAILVAVILLALFGRGTDKVIIALVVVQWTLYARVVRSAALVEKQKEYIEAAECLALGRWRIIFHHLLPNCLPPLIVVATVELAYAIVLEATLSFLGIGLPITEPSLGLLISNGYQYMLSGNYWVSFFPGFALLAIIFSINLVADHLRDILDPRREK
jgi:peptide/nickel transport system permease protein